MNLEMIYEKLLVIEAQNELIIEQNRVLLKSTGEIKYDIVPDLSEKEIEQALIIKCNQGKKSSIDFIRKTLGCKRIQAIAIFHSIQNS